MVLIAENLVGQISPADFSKFTINTYRRNIPVPTTAAAVFFT